MADAVISPLCQHNQHGEHLHAEHASRDSAKAVLSTMVRTSLFTPSLTSCNELMRIEPSGYAAAEVFSCACAPCTGFRIYPNACRTHNSLQYQCPACGLLSYQCNSAMHSMKLTVTSVHAATHQHKQQAAQRALHAGHLQPRLLIGCRNSLELGSHWLSHKRHNFWRCHPGMLCHLLAQMMGAMHCQRGSTLLHVRPCCFNTSNILFAG